jgi:hypothetical protein
LTLMSSPVMTMRYFVVVPGPVPKSGVEHATSCAVMGGHRLAIAEDIGQASAGFLLQHGQPDGECVVQCLRVPAFDLGAL